MRLKTFKQIQQRNLKIVRKNNYFKRIIKNIEELVNIKTAKKIYNYRFKIICGIKYHHFIYLILQMEDGYKYGYLMRNDFLKSKLADKTHINLDNDEEYKEFEKYYVRWNNEIII